MQTIIIPASKFTKMVNPAADNFTTYHAENAFIAHDQHTAINSNGDLVVTFANLDDKILVNYKHRIAFKSCNYKLFIPYLFTAKQKGDR